MSEEMRNGEMQQERKPRELEPQTMGWQEQDALEPELRQALSHFKASVHGWSASMENRPRAARQMRPARRKILRLAAGWALASLMAAAAVSGVVYQRHQKQELAQMEHQRLLEQQQELTEQHQQAEEDLLAKVESDISREVPSAMEPLAQLMSSDGTQTANASQ